MTAPPLSLASRDHIGRGIAYILSCVFLFGVVNALVKLQVASYPSIEVLFFRSIFTLPICAYLIVVGGGVRVLTTTKLKAHIVRGLFHFLSMISMFTAFRLMPLADALAISYSSPLFLTVLSILLLGEKAGIHRWSAVLVGFVGVLIIIRPGTGLLEGGAIFALINAALTALVAIGIRHMSATEASATLLFYQVIVPSLLSAAALPFAWVTPAWNDLAILAVIGILSGIGQYWWMLALRFAPGAVVAPFTYTGLIWGTLFGFLLWGDVPTLAMIFGAFLVAASGLYIVYRETVVRRRKDTPPVMP